MRTLSRAEFDAALKSKPAPDFDALFLEVQALRRQRDELHQTTNLYMHRYRAAEAKLAERALEYTNEPYTIRELDEAIAICMGFNRQIKARPIALDRAAAKAFFAGRPEDVHSRRIRSAYRDLERLGFFVPSDGLWPQDGDEH